MAGPGRLHDMQLTESDTMPILLRLPVASLTTSLLYAPHIEPKDFESSFRASMVGRRQGQVGK